MTTASEPVAVATPISAAGEPPMLDFATVPPEINSGRMYSGPGSGPMLAAAAAWDAVAAALSAAASGYASVVSELTEDFWTGPSSLSMAAAASPYVAWLHGTAAQAEQTAAQAKAAAAAYEVAFAMTVPPPVIAANRSLLMALIATNFFGQNTPAIAATEAHYAEMWAQDATAMYGYAGSSSAATQLSRFTVPAPTTSPVGAAAQGAGSTAGAQPTTISSLLSAIPVALQGTAPTAPSLSSVLSPAFSAFEAVAAAPKFTNTVLSTLSSVTSGRSIHIQDARIAAQAENDAEKAHQRERLVSAGSTGAGGAAITARMGRAGPVGALSAPPAWATAAPEIRQAALVLPQAGAETAAAPTEAAPVQGNVFSQTALGTLSRNETDDQRPQSKPVIVRSPAAG